MTSKFQLKKEIATVQDSRVLQIRTVSRQCPDSIWMAMDDFRWLSIGPEYYLKILTVILHEY